MTENAAFGGSNWIRWEIQEATALAREHHVPFAPVLVGVSNFAILQNFPRETAEFQGIQLDINKPEELKMELGKPIDHFLSRPEWRKAFEEGSRSTQD